jgi:TolA-binding protein
VIKLDSANVSAYYLRGEALFVTQNLEQAKKHFQEALRMNPDHNKSAVAFKRLRGIERTLEAVSTKQNKKSN